MEYEIIQAQRAVELGQTVQARLNDGWALYGNLVVSGEGVTLVYSQAMTRKKKKQQKVRYA
jgi:hypothetical protein